MKEIIEDNDYYVVINRNIKKLPLRTTIILPQAAKYTPKKGYGLENDDGFVRIYEEWKIAESLEELISNINNQIQDLKELKKTA